MRRWLALVLLTVAACASPAAVTPAPTQTSAATVTVVVRPSLTPSLPPATATRRPQPSLTPVDTARLPRGEWVQLRGLPTARSEFSAAGLAGQIFAPGGYVNSRAPWRSSNVLEVFDPVANRWSQRATLPQALNHHMTASHAGRLYVFGGYPDGAGMPEPKAWVYDPAADRWAPIADMPQVRVAGAAVSSGDYLYVVGGWGPDQSQEAMRRLLRYDPAADRWEMLAPLAAPREHTHAVAYDGRLYVFGGRWEVEDLNSVEIYDPATDTWTAGPPLRDRRAGHAVAVVGDQIYVLGGELIMTRIPEEIVATVEVYAPAQNRWVQRFNLPVALHGVAAVGLGDVLYVLGGSTKAGDVINNGQVWAYRP